MGFYPIGCEFESRLVLQIYRKDTQMSVLSLNECVISEGVFIAYPTRSGSSLDMLFGKVLKVNCDKKNWQNKQIIQLTVQGFYKKWNNTWVKQKPSIITRIDRVIVVHVIPNEIRELLKT